MQLQHLAILLQLMMTSFWMDICGCQIVFEDNRRRLPGVSCTTPDRERGNCARWTRCLSLGQKVSDWEQLRPYLCGFAGTEPKVCCPASLLPSISGPSRERISPTTNDFRTSITTSEPKLVLSVPRINPNGSPENSNEKPNFLPDECGSSIFTHNRVIGGQKAEKGSWPWMAVIFKVSRSGYKSSHCGGALVTVSHVITAAHCVVLDHTIVPLELGQLMVRLGVHDLSDENDTDIIDVRVDALRIHERYDPRVLINDIAVVRLSQRIPFSNVTAPVCLPYDSLRYEDLEGKSSTITGFGMTSVNGPFSDVLMEVTFDIQDQETCRRTYERDLRITSGQLCAGTLDGTKDSCQGDSGGPLVTVGKEKRYYLVGIVSFGKNCSQPGYPGVYTRVTEYLGWLTPNLAD